jgi:hypothetical protein
VTAGTLEEMHWEILPHPTYSSDLPPSYFHLFGPLKEEILEGKDLKQTMKLNLLLNYGWMSKDKFCLKES